MNEFMKTVLSLSVSGALLLLFILGLKPFYKNKFSRRWQYYIWIIVALRFLLPLTPGITIVGSLFEKFSTVAETGEIPTVQSVSVPESADNSETKPIQADKELVGLFGVARGGALIYNITLRDYDIMSAGKDAENKSVGAIVAIAYGGRAVDNTVY